MEKKIKKCKGKMCSGSCVTCSYSTWKFLESRYYCNLHGQYVGADDSCDDYD